MPRSGLRRLALAANAGLLLAPAAASGGLPVLARDPAAWTFLVLASLFALGDLATLDHPSDALGDAASRDGSAVGSGTRATRLLALCTGVGVLAALQASLVERGLGAGPAFPAGALVMAAGVALRAWSVHSLGPAFTTELLRSPRVVHGPYRSFRHPSELGLLFVVTGGAALLASEAGLLLAATWVLPASLARIRREDRFLGAPIQSA